MTQRPRGRVDPVERAIEVALEPGRFIPDHACFSFVSDLDEIAATIAKLIPSEPARAVRLYETFLAVATRRPRSWTTRAAASGSSSKTCTAAGGGPEPEFP